VLYQQDGVACRKPADQIHHSEGFFGAHAGERLIKQQQLRIGGEAHGISSWRCSPWLSANAQFIGSIGQAGGVERAARLFHDVIVREGVAEPIQRSRLARLRGEAAILQCAESRKDVGL